MRDITNEILELIRRTCSNLPKDVEERLRASIEGEKIPRCRDDGCTRREPAQSDRRGIPESFG
jgi:hypothetical protein